MPTLESPLLPLLLSLLQVPPPLPRWTSCCCVSPISAVRSMISALRAKTSASSRLGLNARLALDNQYTSVRKLSATHHFQRFSRLDWGFGSPYRIDVSFSPSASSFFRPPLAFCDLPSIPRPAFDAQHFVVHQLRPLPPPKPRSSISAPFAKPYKFGLRQNVGLLSRSTLSHLLRSAKRSDLVALVGYSMP